MVDTARKTVALTGVGLNVPVLGPTGPNTLMRWPPTRTVMQAQDGACAASRRIIAWVGMGGSSAFLQTDSTTPPVTESYSSGNPATYPDVNQWRTKGRFRARLTPGCMLESVVLYVPAGATHQQVIDWEPAGAFGAVRVRVTWDGEITYGPNAFGAIMQPSGLENGQAPQGWAGFWNALRSLKIENIEPPLFSNSAAVVEDVCQSVEVDLLLQVRGGARDVAWIVYEVPRVHAVDHDDAGNHAVHAARGFELPQTPVPQIEAADGVTYEERRFGTYKMLSTAQHQNLVLGPRVAEWSSWDETVGPHGDNPQSDPLEQDPITTSSTTFVGVADPTITEWDADGPGFAVPGCYALRHRHNEETLVMSGGARGVVPVRVWCRARWTNSSGSTSGIVRFQSGPYEWIDISFTSSGNVQELYGYGYMQAGVVPEDVNALLVPLMRVNAGTATLEVWEWSIDFYDEA